MGGTKPECRSRLGPWFAAGLLAVSGPGFAGLNEEWNLGILPGGRDGPVQVYRPSYFLPASRTSHINTQPTSPAPGRSLAAPEELDSVEAKFQFSFKSEFWGTDLESFAYFDRLRLWFGYTQQSHWQVWDSAKSSPFRESNYEPELIVTLGRAKQDANFKFLNLGYVHQSNGQPLPRSRSWWRLYLQGGWESGSWSALVRGWSRTDGRKDGGDNPDIERYLGHGDLVVRFRPNKSYAVDLLVRDNFKRDLNRGFAQLDVSTPWPWPLKSLNSGSSRVHLQATTGYGESLIDYNHRQSTFGLGFSVGLHDPKAQDFSTAKPK